MNLKMLKASYVGFILFVSGFANAGLINVGEYNTSQCCGSGQNGVELTTSNVGGDLVYTGKDSSSGVLSNDIIVAGAWNNMFNNWVLNGGVLIAHDWSNISATLLPGMSGAISTSFSNADVNVLDSLHEIVAGPFGTLNDTIMDGGSSSVHRAFTLSSLSSSDINVSNVRAFLTSGGVDHITAFSYSYGAGHVIYAGMPLEAYTQTVPLNSPNVPGAIMYANNELSYAASLIRTEVPEPSTIAIFGLALMGLASRHFKK